VAVSDLPVRYIGTVWWASCPLASLEVSQGWEGLQLLDMSLVSRGPWFATTLVSGIRVVGAQRTRRIHRGCVAGVRRNRPAIAATVVTGCRHSCPLALDLSEREPRAYSRRVFWTKRATPPVQDDLRGLLVDEHLAGRDTLGFRVGPPAQGRPDTAPQLTGPGARPSSPTASARQRTPWPCPAPRTWSGRTLRSRAPRRPCAPADPVR